MKFLRRWLLRLIVIFVVTSVAVVALLRWVDHPGSAVILQRYIAEGIPQRFEWVPLEAISPHMALAVVAAEDQKFPQHSGFDLAAIRDAVQDRLAGEPLRGASTLSQQVARNLYLWQGRSLVRKGLEAWVTTLIELLWPKRRILEVYLNIAETGERTFGVGPASRRFFKQGPDRLKREQAALIAAVLPNPIRLRIDRPSDYVWQRQAWILKQMSLLGGHSYLRDLLQGRS